MEDIVVFPANILLKSYNVLFYFLDIIQQVTFKRDKYHKYLFYSWSGQNFIVTMWVRDAFIVGFPENKIFFAKRSENDAEFREKKTTKFSTNSLKIAKEFRERNWVFATNSDFWNLISLKPNVVDRRYFKLSILVDQTM